MKQLTIIIILMGLFSFFGFGQDSNNQNRNISPKPDSTDKITQQQLDELYKLSFHGIDLIKDSYIQQGTFLPIGFSISFKNDFKMIVYEEPNIDKMLTDHVYEKIAKLIDKEFSLDGIRIACIIYNGIIKNDKFPNGLDCISLHFKSKDFDNDLLISYPTKVENGEILYGETSIQMINK
jgi:hypothetical protein